jgi:ABC-type antimicrobial peptide transport system permease subunit
MRLYLECVLSGLLGVLIAIGLSLFGFTLWAFVKLRGTEGMMINFDPVSLLRSSAVPWMVMLTAFGSGFFWRLNKARR